MENRNEKNKNGMAAAGEILLSESDQEFLREYKRTLPPKDPADLLSVWLRKVIDIAKEKAVPDLPFADILAEGNLGLTEAFMNGETEENVLRAAVEEQIDRFIREMRLERDADDRLAAQVTLLSDAIDRWSTEYGEKPTIDELANELGVTQERILDILKLTGDEPKDEN